MRNATVHYGADHKRVVLGNMVSKRDALVRVIKEKRGALDCLGECEASQGSTRRGRGRGPWLAECSNSKLPSSLPSLPDRTSRSIL